MAPCRASLRLALSVLALTFAAAACAQSGHGPTSNGDDAGPPGGDDASVTGPRDASLDASGGSDAAAGDASGPACALDAGASDAAGPPLAAGPGTSSSASRTLTLDGAHTGGTFDGIGAISAGGSSRLLVDYPEPYRGQILDYLFKPGYGAALQILKVEIGGDMGSSDGAEASHMHAKNDLSCSRGYEWWLIQQAKARNPNIRLYGLARGAPGWVGSGNFWSADMIQYVVGWLGCAKTNGLAIDYLGGWDDDGYNKDWYENLHAALAQGGFATKIVAADGDWSVAADMASDMTFAGVVDVIGAHYPCGGQGAPALSCATTPNALGLGKPLWASEGGSQDADLGAAALARAVNRGYVDARLTAYLHRSLVAAVPPGTPSITAGLVVANQPGSGAYHVGTSVWASAHTAQFAQPGWLYLDGASGYLGGGGDAGAGATGSYVTLRSPGGQDYSVIIETTTALVPQTVNLTVGGGLSSGPVHVWTTDLTSSDPSAAFVHAADVTPTGGAYWITLPPRSIVTVTTTTGQGKGTAIGPAGASSPLPHLDDFEAPGGGTLANGLADQDGAFEIVTCGAGRSGHCLRQMAPTAPIAWRANSSTPFTLVGSSAWADYSVQADVMLEQPGSIELVGRFEGRDGVQIGHIAAYLLSVSDRGAWEIDRDDTSGNRSTLASGNVATFGLNTWHTMALAMLGGALQATIDGAQVGTANDSTYPVGLAGLAVGFSAGHWATAQFDNLRLEPLGVPIASYTQRIVNRATGLALDVVGESTADGALVDQIAVDPASAGQQWQLLGDGSGYVSAVDVKSGKALEIPGGSSAPGVQLDQRSVAGTSNQQWQILPTGDGFYRLFGRDGLVADGSGVAQNSAAVVQAPLDCTSAAQQWALRSVPIAGVTYVMVNRETGLALDVQGASTSNGGAIVQAQPDGDASQQWRLQALGGGLLVLVNVNSRLVLDVPGGNTTPGTQLDQWSANGGSNQQWVLKPAAAGAYTITSSNGNVLDVQGTAPGGAVVEASPTSAPSQQWQLAPLP